MNQKAFVDKVAVRRFSPLNSLSDTHFDQIALSARCFELPAGTVLQSRLEAGWLIYVLNGRMLHINSKEERYGAVEGATPSAEVPLFTGDGRESGAEAKTRVKILRVDRLLFEVLASREVDTATEVLDIDFDEDDAAIFSSIYDAFADKRLKVPSLPEVLMAVNKAIEDPNMGFKEIATIIQKDPPYTARLLLLANSAAFKGNGSVDTLSFAISRIGVKNVRHLLMGVAVEKMICDVHPSAVGQLREFYREAGEIAALCFVLAKRLGTVPEEQALLAGLLHQLGTVPIVSHAFDVLTPEPDPRRISEAADRLIPSISGWMLSEWGMDAELCDTAESATDWYRPCPESLGLIEVVIAARLLHSAKEGGIPPVSLADTSVGARLIELGLDVRDTEKFYADIASDLDIALQLV